MLKLGILDVEGKKYTLKIGLEYLVGRKSKEISHDIEIDDQSVDIKHSIIDLTQNSSPQLFDVCSKHGTFVDDVQIPRFKSIPLPKTSKIRFGNVDSCLQLVFEGDSGFLEERLNSPTDDTSEIICNSPEHIVSSGSRLLKNSLKNSLTSTPNQSTSTSLTRASNPIANFAIPTCLPRSSIGSNSSARSADSFYIPETQHVPEAANSRTNNSTDISYYSNRSKKNSTVGDDDFFIPETQEVVSTAIPFSNHARLAFPSHDVNETLSEEDRIPSSQFRICTQDFNGSDEDLSNQSGDILANVPLSMIIPPIKHDTVEIDEIIKVDEDDMDNEMSALQWSKKTLEENADGSVTPDGLFDIVGSVTSDLMQVVEKSADNALSQSSTPDIFEIPKESETLAAKPIELPKDQENVTKENLVKTKDPNTDVDLNDPETVAKTANINESNEAVKRVTNKINLKNIDVLQKETEYPPTQVFFKPIAINKSITNNNSLLNDEPEDDCDMLPETQVFAPPTLKSKPAVPHTLTKPQIVPAIDHDEASSPTKLPATRKNHVFAVPQASPKPRASPKSQISPKPQVSPIPQPPHKSPSSTVPIDEDDLPPTQVFLKEDHVPPPVVTNVFSSTLVDCGMQLSENSFKAKFNKLLDSDDDEMDEVIAPHLVKQMRQSLDKPVQPGLFTEIPLTPENEQATPSKQKENIASDKNLTITPDNNNFQIPVKASKTTNYSKTSAVSIDNFLLTPDFLGKELSKNSQLQREAEINWRNLVLEKRNKALFGDENDPKDNLAIIDSDDSQDSFIDLLPKKRETRSKSVNKIPSEKVEKPKKEEEVVCRKITRRQSTLTGNTITKDDFNKTEPKKRGRKRKDTKTTDIKDQNPNVAEEPKDSKNDKVSKIEKVCKQKNVPKKDTELETEKNKKIDNNSKTETIHKITKEAEIVIDPTVVKTSSRVKDSSTVKSDLVKDSIVVKEDKLSKKPSSSNESSSNRNSNSIKETNEIRTRTVSKESPQSRTSSATSVNTSKESKAKIESSKKTVGEKTRTRRRVEESTDKVEEKSSRSRAVKRNAEVFKTASKINKLDGVDVDSKQNTDMPPTRITRLRSASEMKVDDKKVTLNNNRKEKKDEMKKQEPTKKTSTTKTSRIVEESIDLTDSDKEGKTANKKTAKKRKSQEEYVYKSRKSSISASQSSAESNDSDRTLRKKKKIKIAMTSSSPATREALVRYSGRVWDYTEDPKECDVLILETGNRTYKLLVAIARGVPVVKVDWLKEVIMMRSTDVPFEKHLFDEPNFHNRHKFVMRNSLQMAKSASLFSGMNFMMTPNITPNPDEMKDIITCAGGTVLDKIPTSQDDRKFYLVSEKIDSQLWYRYRRVSQDVKVVTAISLMASVMQQSLEPLIKSIH